ncbi:hypothetical protein GQ473_03210, partial [archaeon]|nr:hypothetical protein [archaeon]
KTNDSATLTNWNHIVVTAKTNDRYDLYINGILSISDTSFGAFAITEINNNIIGSSRGYNGNFFKGVIDDIRVYNKQLSQSDVDSIYTATEPTYSFGAEESQSGTPPSITINSPANTTYYTTSIPLNVTVSDSDSASFWCAIYNDGVLVTNETTNTTYTTTLTKNGGSHNVSVHCEDVDTSTSDDVEYYYVFMGLNVSAFNGGNASALAGWNIYTTNGTFNYSDTGLTNPTLIDIANLPTGSVNITFEKTGFKNATYTRTLNNSAFVQLDGNIYYNQLFYAKDIDTDATLNIWNILLTNGTSNATQAVITGTASFGLDELPQGSVNVTISKDGYNTNTTTITIDGNSTIAYTTYLKKAGLYVIVKDETTLAALNFNITIFNSTNTQTWTNESEFSKAWDKIPSGIITIQIIDFGGNYTGRNYYTTITSTTAYTLTSYLLSYANSINVGFVAIDSYDATLSSVLITAQKLYNITWTTVAQGKTDGAGTTNIYMNPLVSYKIKVEKGGYITQYVTITPSATNPTYTIRLPSVRAINFTTLFDDISYRFTPQTPGLETEIIQYINFTISSSGGNLQYYGLNITYNGSVIFSHEVTTDPYGGEIGALVNLTGKTGTLYVNGYFFKTDYGLTYLNTAYRIWDYEYGNYTVAAIIESWKNETHISKDVSAITLSILCVCVMIPVASVVSIGAGIIGVIMLSFGLYAEIITMGQWIITLLVVISIMYIRGRI